MKKYNIFNPEFNRYFTVEFDEKSGVGKTLNVTQEILDQHYGNRESCDYDPPTYQFYEKIKDFFGRRYIKKILRSTDQNVLDFSTGNGRFAVLLSEFGKGKISVSTTDIFADRSEALVGRNEISYTQLSEFENVKKTYDLIIMRHVLEHLPEPEKTLAMLRDRLSEICIKKAVP